MGGNIDVREDTKEEHDADGLKWNGNKRNVHGTGIARNENRQD